MCYIFLSTDGSGHPLPPPLRFPCTDFHVFSQFSCACISFSSSCLLSVRLSFICRPSSVAPVFTRRLPWWLTGGRCHAAPGVLSIVPMFEGPPPPELCGWWYLARVWVEGHRRWCPPQLSWGPQCVFTIPPEGLEYLGQKYLWQSWFPSMILVPISVCPPPPPLFPVQPYLSRYPPY